MKPCYVCPEGIADTYQDLLAVDNVLRKALKKDKTTTYFNDLRSLVEIGSNELSHLIGGYLRRGSGKTYNGLGKMNLLRKLGIEFSVRDNVVFSDSELHQKIESASNSVEKFGSAYLVDEPDSKIAIGTGSMALKEHLNKLEATMRKASLFLDWCAPDYVHREYIYIFKSYDYFYVNPNRKEKLDIEIKERGYTKLAPEKYFQFLVKGYWLLEGRGKTKHNVVSRLIREYPNQDSLYEEALRTWNCIIRVNRTIMYPSDLKMPIGYVHFPIPDFDDVLQYEDLKDKFIEKVQFAGSTDGPFAIHRKYAEKLKDDPRYTSRKSYKERAVVIKMLVQGGDLLTEGAVKQIDTIATVLRQDDELKVNNLKEVR